VVDSLILSGEFDEANKATEVTKKGIQTGQEEVQKAVIKNKTIQDAIQNPDISADELTDIATSILARKAIKDSIRKANNYKP
jgi:hypothetical protein